MKEVIERLAKVTQEIRERADAIKYAYDREQIKQDDELEDILKELDAKANYLNKKLKETEKNWIPPWD